MTKRSREVRQLRQLAKDTTKWVDANCASSVHHNRVWDILWNTHCRMAGRLSDLDKNNLFEGIEYFMELVGISDDVSSAR